MKIQEQQSPASSRLHIIRLYSGGELRQSEIPFPTGDRVQPSMTTILGNRFRGIPQHIHTGRRCRLLLSDVSLLLRALDYARYTLYYIYLTYWQLCAIYLGSLCPSRPARHDRLGNIKEVVPPVGQNFRHSWGTRNFWFFNFSILWISRQISNFAHLKNIKNSQSKFVKTICAKE
jgi:hypothetical protein